MTSPSITADSYSNINVENADLVVTQNVYCSKIFNSNYVSSESDLSNYDASTYHGMVMHVHGTGALYYAHGGSWRKLLTDVSGGSVTNYTSPLDSVAYDGDGGNLSNVVTISSSALTGSETGTWYPLVYQSGKTEYRDTNLSWEPTSQKLTAGIFAGDGGLLSNISGGGGGGSTSSNLQVITDNGNVTSNTLILEGGFVTGNVATSLSVTSSGELNVDMGSISYKTFTCTATQNITKITFFNDIMGSQGMIFITAGSDITINGITSSLGGTNVYVSHDDVSVTNGNSAIIFFASDGTNRYVNAGKYPGEVTTSSGGGGGGSTSSNLQVVTDNGNVTSNTLILDGGFVTGNTATDLSVIDNTITIDMGGKSYQTFTCSTANNISNIEVSGDILGSQGMIYVNAGSAITLNGITSTLGGSNVFVSYDDLSIGANSNAIIFFTSDGTNRYVNAGKYPGEVTTSSGGSTSSNLQVITDNGNVTSNTLILNGSLVTGNVATDLSAVSNTLTIDMGGKSYQTFTCSTANNISNIEVSGDILGSQGMVFVTADGGEITIAGNTANLGGSNVNVSYDDIVLSDGEKAIIGFMSDGTNKFINAAKYPSSSGGGGLSNLQTITDNGNVTTNSITASYFIGDGSQLTNLPVGGSGGGGGVQECFDAHPTSAQNVTSLTRIILNNTRYNSNASVFSLNTSTGQVTVNKTALYMINYTMSTGISSSSSNRSTSKADLYINNSVVSYTSVYMYNRMNNREENTGSQTIFRQLTAGDIVDIRAQRLAGGDTITSVHGGTGLRILEIMS